MSKTSFLYYEPTPGSLKLAFNMSKALQEAGFNVISPARFNNALPNIGESINERVIAKALSNADLFIGVLLSQNSDYLNQLNTWYTTARSLDVPSFILAQEKYANSFHLSGNIGKDPMKIVFDPNNPGEAIEYIKHRHEISLIEMQAKKNESNSMGWILGGAALIGLVSLLSKKS